LIKEYKTWVMGNMKLILAIIVIIVFVIIIFLAGIRYGSNHITKSLIDAENKRINEYWKQRYEEILKVKLEFVIADDELGGEVVVTLDGESRDVMTIFETIKQLISKEGWKLE
jgi:hypothetical protein